jgi:hypothetical protein
MTLGDALTSIDRTRTRARIRPIMEEASPSVTTSPGGTRA